MQLRCAMIFVKDLERMTRFYRDAIGLAPRPRSRGDDWVEFDAGGAALALHAIPAELASDITVTDPPVAREATPLKLVFEVADLDAARRHLIDHGAVMFDVRPWGACDGLDPEGNVFQIARA